MYLSKQGWILAPFYDLLNVKLILPKDKEDFALMLGGKKKNFKKGHFDCLGEVLKLNDKQINSVYKRLEKWLLNATALINDSFLDEERKNNYKELIKERVKEISETTI
jgi:serine/threonine-protein kinase HipA